MQNRINLLSPSTSVHTKNVSEEPNKVLIIICILSVITTVVFYGTFFGLEWIARNSYEKVKNEIAALAEVNRQLNLKGSLINEKDKATSNVKSLGSARPILSKNLDGLSKVIPTALTLTNLEIKNKPFDIRIKGVSNSNLLIAQFGKNLQEHEVFKDAIVSSSKKKIKENTYEYTINITPENKGGNN